MDIGNVYIEDVEINFIELNWIEYVAQWDITSWCWWLDLRVVQHCKVTMSAHCHKSVSVLI